MTQTEDGGVEIDFDPNAMAGAGTVNHDENLTMLQSTFSRLKDIDISYY